MVGKVNWYGNDVMIAVLGASDELVTSLAFQVEAEAKPNMPVDTGFMRNATYVIPAGEQPMERGWASGKYKSDATGEMVQRNRVVRSPNLGKHTAGVHMAAEYSIYQEIKKSFLYNALQKVAKSVGSTVKEVKRSNGL